VTTLADAEGLEAHAHSVDARFDADDADAERPGE